MSKAAQIKNRAGLKVLIACSVLAVGLLAGLTSVTWSEAGLSSDFLKFKPGARALAMAEAFSAQHQDSELIFYNPAGITSLLNPQMGASHILWWQDVTVSGIWGVQPMSGLGSFGWSVLFLNVPPFNSTNDEQAEKLHAWAGRLSLVYAKMVTKKLSLGSQVQFGLQQLDDRQSQAIALNLGGQYFFLNDQLILGLVIENLGLATAYVEQSDPVPGRAIAGLSYQFWPDDQNGLTLSSEIRQPFNDAVQLAMGMEIKFYRHVFIRAGLRTPADAGHWLSLGLGIKHGRVMIDYTLSPLSELGLSHQVAIKYNFGSQRRLPRPKISVTLVHKQFVYDNGQPGQDVHFIPEIVAAAGIKQWQLTIVNQQNNQIRNYTGKGNVPMKVVWDNLDAAGERVNAEAYYRYQFRVIDNNNYTAQKVGEILPISITQLPKLKALPRDIFAGQVSFESNSQRPIKQWTIKVVNHKGQVLKKYQGHGMIPKDFAWDGRDQENRQVALKQGHRFIISLTDTADNEISSEAPIVMVKAGTKAKTEEGLPLPEQVPFRFDFDKNAKISSWSLDILETGSGKVLRSVNSDGVLPEQIFWDTRDEKGHVVASNKSYSYVLRLQDPIGNVWRQADQLSETEVKVLKDDQNEVRVKIEQILFDFNQAELKPAMHDKLKKTADIVREYQDHNVKVFVEGHTDDIGSKAYNLELSEKRAQMVMRYLVEEEAVPSSVIIMKGYGKSLPIRRSRSAEARAHNRRVEITIVLPKKH